MLRTTFAIGLVLSAIPMAEAGSRSFVESYPTIATLPSWKAAPAATPPSVQPAGPGPAAAAAEKPELRSRRRGRSRYARTDALQPGGAQPGKPPASVASISPATATASAAPVATPPTTPLLRGQEAPAKTPAETAPETSHAVEAASPTLAALIAKHAVAAGVPVGLAQAVVRIESRGNVHASHAGALGLMQIKAGTARAAGFMGNASGLLDADTNLRFGMKVLADAYKGAGGDVCRALMKYQSGHLATRMTRANRTYCSKARAIMAGA